MHLAALVTLVAIDRNRDASERVDAITGMRNKTTKT
jgi:hypothetical protein